MTEFKLSMINWMNCIWSTDLPSQSKLIAAYLRSHMNDHHDMAWPSLSTIQGKTNLSRSTVVKYIDILCEKEWLTRDKQTRTSTTYIASFPKSVENGLKVISNSTPDELAKLATSTCGELGSTCGELGSTCGELALVRETNSNKQDNKQVNNIKPCFEDFWKNWRHCKTAIGLGKNYGVKNEALAKWKTVFSGKSDVEDCTNKIIDLMIEIYSDIHECQEQNKQSIYSNFTNMYPQKFIDRAKEMVSEQC